MNKSRFFGLRIPSLRMMLLICSIASFVIARCRSGFVGYDCGSTTQNMTTISLLHVEKCDFEPEKMKVTTEQIRLVQLDQFSHPDVIQCKVIITRHIDYCGWQSYTSTVPDAHRTYIMEITHSECAKAHETGYLSVGNTHIEGLKVNKKFRAGLFLAGSVDSQGNCKTGSYMDEYGTYNNVVVQAEVVISLRSQTAKVDLDLNEIVLHSGTVCPFTSGTCMDLESGYTFWNHVPKVQSCPAKRYSSLYYGLAKKIESENETLFSVELNQISFIMSITGTAEFCNLVLKRTEHPKLFILDSNPSSPYVTEVLNTLGVDNMDLMTYVNAKYIYVERHIRGQIKKLYKSLMVARCEMERQILQNSLAIATLMPDEFALRLMKGPGYMAVTAGEVIHVVKCIPTDVQVHNDGKCYDKLMVKKDNHTFFLTPRTHILMTRAVEIPCDSLLSHYYQLHGIWYKMLPEPVQVIAPNTLKTSHGFDWKYNNPANLATSGIYSPEDTEKMKNMIMSGMEQRPVLEEISRGIISADSSHHKGTLYDVLDNESLEKLAQSAWDRTWGRFVKFGTYSAGFIGIFLIIRFIRVLIDVLIHGYSLHSIFGWSYKLIGAFFSSVTGLLLHQHHSKSKNSSSQDRDTTNALPSPSDEVHNREVQPPPTSIVLNIEQELEDEEESTENVEEQQLSKNQKKKQKKQNRFK